MEFSSSPGSSRSSELALPGRKTSKNVFFFERCFGLRFFWGVGVDGLV